MTVFHVVIDHFIYDKAKETSWQPASLPDCCKLPSTYSPLGSGAMGIGRVPLLSLYDLLSEKTGAALNGRDRNTRMETQWNGNAINLVLNDGNRVSSLRHFIFDLEKLCRVLVWGIENIVVQVCIYTQRLLNSLNVY